VSARIEAFNTEYSPQNGYRIESSMQDSLSLQPGVLSLLREVIASGKGPADIGLKDLEAGIVMVCTHRLLDKDGNVVRDASAAKPIRAYKDYEILETASLQRLMAKCGHGGEVFDDDEDRDIADQAKDHTPPAQVTPLPVESASSPGQKVTEPAVPAVPAPSESDDGNATTDDAGAEETSVPTAMLRQIESLAERLDEAPPEVTTLDEAKKALKDLTSRAQSVRAAAQA
jgi:hypothetical protein